MIIVSGVHLPSATFSRPFGLVANPRRRRYPEQENLYLAPHVSGVKLGLHLCRKEALSLSPSTPALRICSFSLNPKRNGCSTHGHYITLSNTCQQNPSTGARVVPGAVFWNSKRYVPYYSPRSQLLPGPTHSMPPRRASVYGGSSRQGLRGSDQAPGTFFHHDPSLAPARRPARHSPREPSDSSQGHWWMTAHHRTRANAIWTRSTLLSAAFGGVPGPNMRFFVPGGAYVRASG